MAGSGESDQSLRLPHAPSLVVEQEGADALGAGAVDILVTALGGIMASVSGKKGLPFSRRLWIFGTFVQVPETLQPSASKASARVTPT